MDLATIGFRADTSGINRAGRGLDDLARQGGRTESSLNNSSASISRGFSSVQSAVALVGTAITALTAGALSKYADTATSVENQLRAVTNSTTELAAAQDRLGAIANETRSGYQSTVELYSKLSRSTTELNISQERLYRITETINKAFASSGATAIEADSAIRQLAQGLASGALRGDEFNSVAEQAPEILRAVAKETGMTVGQLREFAAQGGITSELLIKSLENYQETVDRVYGKTSATISQSLTIANNNAIKYVESNEKLRALAGVVGESIIALSNNIDKISSAALAASSVIGLNLVASITSAAAATLTKVKSDLAAAAAAKAATVAELELAAATAAQATISAAASVASAKESVQRLAATQASLVAEMNLEKVRMAAQISEIGRIQTATRMAEIGAARVAVTAQLTAAETRLAAATTASVAAEAGQVAALGAVSAAQAKTTITATALGAVWRFMLGPWGLLITALGVGAAAFMTTSNSADEFAQATKNASDAVDELGNKLDNTNRIYATYMASQKAATASALSGLGQVELQAEFDKSSRRIEIYNEQLEKLIKSSASFARIESVRQKLANEKIALEELLKLMPTAKTSYEMLSESAQKLVDRLDPLAAANRTYAAEMKLLDEAVGKNIISTAQYTKLVEALKFEHAGGEKAIDEYRKAMEKLDERMQDHYDGLEILKEIEGDRISQLEEAADAAYEWENRTVEGVEKVASLSEKAAERIESAFADAWMNAFDGMNSVVDGMKNAFKRMLAEMAHMALTKPIMVSIGMVGMLPGGASAATAAAGKSGFDAASAAGSLGAIGGISSGIISAGGAIGGAFGGGLAASGGLLANGSIGAMFSGAGSLFGSGNIMAGLGMSMPIIAGAVTAAMGINKLTGGGLFGTSYKQTGQSLNLSYGGGMTDGSILTEEERKKSLFRGTKRRTTSTDFDTSALDDAFNAIENQIIAASEALGLNGAKAILDGFTASAKIDIKGLSESEINEKMQAWMVETADSMVIAVFGATLSEFQKQGEGYIDTLNRLAINVSAVKNITSALGLDFGLTGEAALKAATNIVELAGGLDQLAALSNQYYQSFYSETERQLRLQEQLAGEFSKLNATVPTTREQFRAMVDALDLTTAADQAKFAALMQLVPAMDQYLTTIEAQTAASQQAADAATKEAEAKSAALKASQSSLELRLMDALGQSSEALAVRRQMELDATDASLHALLRSIYTAEDAAAAQRELASAQASAASSARSAAQDAFSKLKDTASAEKDRLKTELDLKLDTIDKERSALESQRDSVIDGYNEQSKAVEQYVSRLEGLNGVINGFLASTGAAVDPFKRLTQIFNEAKAGLLPDQSELQSVLSGISSAGSGGFSSAFEQQRAMAIARSQASGIGGMVGGQLSGERSQLSLIQQQVTEASKYYDDQLAKLDTAAEQAQKLHDEQVGKIDAQLTEAEKQYNALMGIDDRILTMEQALNEFNSALAATGEATLAVEIQQVEAINRVEAAIVNMGAQLIEMSKPEDRIWLPPIEAPKQPFEGEPVTREMVDLLKELVAASDATAKHTKKAADELELTRYETLEP